MRFNNNIVLTWRAKHKSVQKQAEVLEEMERIMDTISPDDPEGTHILMDEIYKQVADNGNVSKSTVRRWWKYFIQMGELPYEGKERAKELLRKYKWLPKGAKINQRDLDVLLNIIEKNPTLYLDEIAVQLGNETGKYVPISTLWKYITRYLGKTQQVMRRRASQQCEVAQARFKRALELLLQGDPERLVLIDETHKDRNAARRSRGWGRRNNKLGDSIISEWYKSVVRYTLIAVADINGFIESACDTVLRDEISNEGAAGTVNREYFVNWVKTKLCPILGRYEYGEPRSVVMLDNASTHMCAEVTDLIEATGAVIIYSAPFSPQLNPIENYFSMYKKYLKFVGEQPKAEWIHAHQAALDCVQRENGLHYFASCGIPGVENLVL